jgi:small subunit ribosomal protein S17
MATEEKQNQAPQGHKNEKVGQVVSAKMQKTIVVEVTRRVTHPLDKRIVQKRKKFYAHDEQGEAKVGDVVRIIECRPLSRLKRWRLGDIIRRSIDPLAGIKQAETPQE